MAGQILVAAASGAAFVAGAALLGFAVFAGTSLIGFGLYRRNRRYPRGPSRASGGPGARGTPRYQAPPQRQPPGLAAAAPKDPTRTLSPSPSGVRRDRPMTASASSQRSAAPAAKTPWPTRRKILDDLIDHPDRFAPHPALDGATFEEGPTGIQCFGGSNAFTVPYTNDAGESWLLRFFNSEPNPAQVKRYRHLEMLPRDVGLALGLPRTYWLDDYRSDARGVRRTTDSARTPAVLMTRVDGQHMDRFVAKHCGDRQGLLVAAARLRDRLLHFEAHQFAHGDLQDGNILVVSDGPGTSIWFVDLDDCYLPGVETSHSVGHSNYQHPKRTPKHFGPLMDGFSGLLLWVALRAIAADPQLWYDNDDDGRLLFELPDLQRPGDTDLWRALADSSDPEVRGGAERLANLCRAPGPPSVPFADLLPGW